MINPLLKNKKGNFEQTFFVIVMIFAMGIFLFFLLFFAQETLPRIKESLTDSTPEDPSANVSVILDKTLTSTERYDAWYPFLLFGIFGYLFVTAFFIKSHPMLFFIGIIVLLIALMIGGVFSNIYERLADKEQLSDVNDEMNITRVYMDWLPAIVFAVFLFLAFVLYINKGGATGGL